MTPECRALLGSSADDMWARYFSVFLDNNSRERYSFFSDPLIQHLWGNFRRDYGEKILQYVDSVGIPDLEMFECKKSRFVRDICNM